MQIVLAVLYVLVGLLLAIPYCFLAGWNQENLFAVAFAAPAFLFVWFVTASISGVIDHGRTRTIRFNWRVAFGRSKRRTLPGSLAGFWLWTFYSFLPVLLHGSALLLESVGYETVGSFVDAHRYASTLYVPTAMLMLVILLGMVSSAWGAVKSVWMRFAHR